MDEEEFYNKLGKFTGEVSISNPLSISYGSFTTKMVKNGYDPDEVLYIVKDILGKSTNNPHQFVLDVLSEIIPYIEKKIKRDIKKSI